MHRLRHRRHHRRGCMHRLRRNHVRRLHRRRDGSSSMHRLDGWKTCWRRCAGRHVHSRRWPCLVAGGDPPSRDVDGDPCAESDVTCARVALGADLHRHLHTVGDGTVVREVGRCTRGHGYPAGTGRDRCRPDDLDAFGVGPCCGLRIHAGIGAEGAVAADVDPNRGADLVAGLDAPDGVRLEQARVDGRLARLVVVRRTDGASCAQARDDVAVLGLLDSDSRVDLEGALPHRHLGPHGGLVPEDVPRGLGLGEHSDVCPEGPVPACVESCCETGLVGRRHAVRRLVLKDATVCGDLACRVVVGHPRHEADVRPARQGAVMGGCDAVRVGQRDTVVEVQRGCCADVSSIGAGVGPHLAVRPNAEAHYAADVDGRRDACLDPDSLRVGGAGEHACVDGHGPVRLGADALSASHPEAVALAVAVDVELHPDGLVDLDAAVSDGEADARTEVAADVALDVAGVVDLDVDDPCTGVRNAGQQAVPRTVSVVRGKLSRCVDPVDHGDGRSSDNSEDLVEHGRLTARGGVRDLAHAPSGDGRHGTLDVAPGVVRPTCRTDVCVDRIGDPVMVDISVVGLEVDHVVPAVSVGVGLRRIGRDTLEGSRDLVAVVDPVPVGVGVCGVGA